MQIFVTTIHGISIGYYLEPYKYLFQGMIQGNGVASPTWILLAIMIILFLYKQELTSHLITLITKE